MGRRETRLRDMLKLWTEMGRNPRIFGYMSRGESVPDVMMTDWNPANTGAMALDASMHQNRSFPARMVGARSSNGSMMRQNPVCV